MSRCPVIILILTLTSLGACTSNSGGPAAVSPKPSPPAAPLPDVDGFVKRLATQDGCRDSSAEMRLTVEGEAGRREQLDFKLQRKYAPEQISTLLTVTAPREESEKALLVFERPEQSTEAFSYLAGLKRLTRLKSDSFLSFRSARTTVQELLGLELTQYTHGPAERVSGGEEPLVKVEFTGKFDRGLAFPRIIGFFREADQSPARFELYNSRNELAKVVQIEEVKQIQGHQTVTRLVIEDRTQGRKLKLEVLGIKYDQSLPDAIFTEDHLVKLVSGASRKLVQ